MIKVSCPKSVKYGSSIFNPSEPFLIDEKDLAEMQKLGATVLQETVTKKNIKKEEATASKIETVEEVKEPTDKKSKKGKED